MGKYIGLYNRFLNLSLAARICILFLVALIIIYFIGVSMKGGDFASYLEASTKMINGIDIYDPPHIHLRYSYSPFWAMILMPLALLPMPVAIFIWLVINVFILCRTIFLLRNYFNIKYLEKRRDVILWLCILLFMSRFIELNFHHAQMTIFLLWAILESMVLSANQHNIRAGVLIGFATIIKIMPIVIVPYFIYRKKFIAAFVSVITIVFTFFFPILYLGSEQFWALNKTWFQILRPDNSDFLADNTDYFSHNISAFLYRILMKTNAPYIHNIFSLSLEKATIVIWIIITVLIVFTLYFLATLPFKEITSKKHILYEVSYITLLLPLIFPHQMKYAFYFLLPAVCCLTKFILDNYKKQKEEFTYKSIVVSVFVSFILCTMTTDLLLGMNGSIITQYLKTITIGSLVLIPALAIEKKYFVND